MSRVSQGRNPDPPGPSFRKPRYHWVHFVGRASEPGRLWREVYDRPSCLAVRTSARAGLRALFQRRMDEGRRAFDDGAAALDDLGDVPTSVRLVLERWHYGARAYLQYCLGRLDAALVDLARAEGSVVTAIELDSMLLPAAQECPDFPHQRIRVARQGRQWDEMKRQIVVEREMLASERPLCVLANGTSIDYDTVTRYYRDRHWDADERAYLDSFLDQPARLRAFDHGMPAMYALAGWAVPIP